MLKCSGSGIKSLKTFLFQWRVNLIKPVYCAVFKFQSFQIFLFKGTAFGTEKKDIKHCLKVSGTCKVYMSVKKKLNLLNKASMDSKTCMFFPLKNGRRVK